VAYLISTITSQRVRQTGLLLLLEKGNLNSLLSKSKDKVPLLTKLLNQPKPKKQAFHVQEYYSRHCWCVYPYLNRKRASGLMGVVAVWHSSFMSA
jgi:hypothetical protein